MSDLNGRPAEVFVVEISANQFRVTRQTDHGPELMGLSSSLSTLEKCVSDMLALGTGQPRVPCHIGDVPILSERKN
jgi:hypothetical protein